MTIFELLNAMINLAKMYGITSANYESRLDYDANGNCLYFGFAVLNTPTSASSWFILAYTIANGLVTRIRYFGPNQTWDNRAIL